MRTGTIEAIALISDEPGRKVWSVNQRFVCTADEHETLDAGKNHGCTCPRTSLIVSAYEKRRRNGKVAMEPAVQTRTRLRTLIANGWSPENIAPRVGVTPESLRCIARAETQQVRQSTARMVELVYAEMAGVRGPSRWCIAYARNQGWHGLAAQPYAWLSDVVVASRRCGFPVEQEAAG